MSQVQVFAPHVPRRRVVAWLRNRAQEDVYDHDAAQEAQEYLDRTAALYRGDGAVCMLTRETLEVARADELGLPRHSIHLAVSFRKRERTKGGHRWIPTGFRDEHAERWAELVFDDLLERTFVTLQEGEGTAPAAHWRLFTDAAWTPLEELPDEDELLSLGYHAWPDLQEADATVPAR